MIKTKVLRFLFGRFENFAYLCHQSELVIAKEYDTIYLQIPQAGGDNGLCGDDERSHTTGAAD